MTVDSVTVDSVTVDSVTVDSVTVDSVTVDSASLGGGGEKSNKVTQPNEQIDANRESSKITEQFLIEHLLSHGDNPPVDTALDYNDTKDCITRRCYKAFRHGSQNTIDRALKMMTCSEAPFSREKRKGRMVIFTKTGL